jgi:SAM-dependent methyltransferase
MDSAVSSSVPAQYFIELYRRDADPWNFAGSSYEREKYRATLDALPRTQYTSALEIACSIGVFTSMLAARCHDLLAVDVSPEAVERARVRCEALANVRFETRAIPRDYPDGLFDLTTICEVGYYFDLRDLHALCAKAARHSAPGGHIVLVHWTPPVHGHASTAEQVHETFCASNAFRRLHGFSTATYRLDVLERRADA